MKKTILIPIVVVLAALSIFLVLSNQGNQTPLPPTQPEHGATKPQQTRTYRFGAVLPLTGPGSALGDLIKRGLDIGLADANKEVPGLKIKAIFDDSKTNPAQGLTAFRKLVNVDKVKVVLVAFSAICNSVAPVAEEERVLMVGMTTSMPGLPEGKEYVIRLFPNADMLAGTIADYSATKYSRVAVVYAEDEYGKNTFLTFKNRFAGDGRQIVFSEAFQPKETQFRTTVAKMMELKPDAIYLPGYGPGYIALIKQIRERDKRVPIMGDSPLSNPPVYRAAGNAVEGVIVPATPLDAGVAETDAQKQFLARYRKEYNEEPSINISINYDFIQILARALKKTDGTPEAIRDFFIKQSPHLGLTGTIRYQPDGESLVQVRPMRISAGAIRLLRDEGSPQSTPDAKQRP